MNVKYYISDLEDSIRFVEVDDHFEIKILIGVAVFNKYNAMTLDRCGKYIKNKFGIWAFDPIGGNSNVIMSILPTTSLTIHTNEIGEFNVGDSSGKKSSIKLTMEDYDELKRLIDFKWKAFRGVYMCDKCNKMLESLSNMRLRPDVDTGVVNVKTWVNIDSHSSERKGGEKDDHFAKRIINQQINYPHTFEDAVDTGSGVFEVTFEIKI